MAQECILIGIAGASGSGKSTLAEALRARLEQADQGPVRLIGEDAYYRDQSALPMAERAVQNYDEPAAMDHDLLLQHLRQLASGQVVEQPVYDYYRHTRVSRTLTLEPAPIVLVEGLFLLSRRALCRVLDLALYVDTDPDLCLLRRLRRDVRERGRTVDSVLAQYEHTVRPGMLRHVLPSRAHADAAVDGSNTEAEMIDQGWAALRRVLERVETNRGD